jgi:hypothetical protein
MLRLGRRHHPWVVPGGGSGVVAFHLTFRVQIEGMASSLQITNKVVNGLCGGSGVSDIVYSVRLVHEIRSVGKKESI